MLELRHEYNLPLKETVEFLPYIHSGYLMILEKARAAQNGEQNQ